MMKDAHRSRMVVYYRHACVEERYIRCLMEWCGERVGKEGEREGGGMTGSILAEKLVYN